MSATIDVAADRSKLPRLQLSCRTRRADMRVTARCLNKGCGSPEAGEGWARLLRTRPLQGWGRSMPMSDDEAIRAAKELMQRHERRVRAQVQKDAAKILGANQVPSKSLSEKP